MSAFDPNRTQIGDRVEHTLDALGLEMMTMAGDPPREIKSLIDNHIDGFNTQNIELFLGVFGDTAIIIDGSHLIAG